jgi:hypothetical protein
LSTINAVPLPYHIPPTLGGGVVTHGELLLRADGTFVLGYSDPAVPMLERGRWRLAGSALRLSVTESFEAPVMDREWQGTLAADSVTLTSPGNHVWVFGRSTIDPVRIMSGTYVLATMNGSADLTFEYSWFDQRVVERVLFDSITFFDGVYYRRHRAERNVAVVAAGDSLRDGYEFLTFGSYGGADAVLVLRDYMRQSSRGLRAVDSLAVNQEALVRRIPRLHPETRVSFIWEDVYHRRR